MASSGWPQVIGAVAENIREFTHLFAPKIISLVRLDRLVVGAGTSEWLAGKWYDKTT